MIDSVTLEKYLAKRKEWFSWYDISETEPNSIQSQIHLMLLSEMSYRVSIAEHRTENTELSGLPVLGYLLESGYFATQILAIRRLLDPAQTVHSVSRLLADLEVNCSLLTREAFVEFDGIGYELDHPASIIPGLQSQNSPFSHYTRCQRRHERFDRLAKVPPNKRLPEDVIHPSIFEQLNSWLKSAGTDKLRKISNKYLAHAADKKSRGSLAPVGLDFKEIESAQRAVVRVTKAIYDIILQSDVFSPVVPMVPLGYFGTVWQGNAMIVSTARMHARWDELEKARNSWPDQLEEQLCE